jgi:SAM-dependent methyltransferase
MYRGFPKALLNSIVCHSCLGDLKVDIDVGDGERIVSGLIQCSSCGIRYPIEDGIVNLLGEQAPLDEVSKQEVLSRDAEADIYDEAFCTPEGNLMEATPTLEHLGHVDRKRILELGCGTGRITLPLAPKVSSILALDYSRGSLVHLARKCPDDTPVGLVSADITQARFRDGYFDGAVSAQVLQHIRYLEARRQFYAAVRDALRPGSVFVLSAYHYDLKKRLRREPRDGFHSSNIFFHHFTSGEIRDEMSPFFEVDEIHPLEIHIPWVHKAFKDKVRFSRSLEHLPLLNLFGEWLIFKGFRN